MDKAYHTLQPNMADSYNDLCKLTGKAWEPDGDFDFELTGWFRKALKNKKDAYLERYEQASVTNITWDPKPGIVTVELISEIDFRNSDNMTLHMVLYDALELYFKDECKLYSKESHKDDTEQLKYFGMKYAFLQKAEEIFKEIRPLRDHESTFWAQTKKGGRGLLFNFSQSGENIKVDIYNYGQVTEPLGKNYKTSSSYLVNNIAQLERMFEGIERICK